MASAQTTDSDIEDTSQFNPDDWIGLGKGRNVPAPNDFPTVLDISCRDSPRRQY